MNLYRTSRAIPRQFFLSNTTQLDRPANAIPTEPSAITAQLDRRFTTIHQQSSIDEESEVSVFGRLVKWAEPLRSADLTTILIRHHDDHPLHVQSHLLKTAISPSRAYLRPTESSQTPFSTPPILDLTPFPTPASLIFTHYLLTRSLPTLQTASIPASNALPAAHLMQPNDLRSLSPQHRASLIFSTTRQNQQVFNQGLTQAWRLGAAIGAGQFQNAVLKAVARSLEREEKDAKKSVDPRINSAVAWARNAWETAKGGLPDVCSGCGVPVGDDGTSQHEHEKTDNAWSGPLAEFAVDVAARRVWVVGAKRLVLTPEERSDLGSRSDFAGEVLARVGGQIGMKGVRIGDLVKDYLVEEERKD